MDKKRIFIAIPAVNLGDQAMRFSLAKTFGQWPIRWYQSQDLHITISLTPPIEVGPERLAQLVDQLKTVSDIKPFEVHFDKVEFGPDLNDPRLIWARGQTPTELELLRGGINKAIGYHPDRAKLLMHVTLARFKEKDYRPEWSEQLDQKVHWPMLVNSFAIFESKRINGITQFPIVEQFELR